MRQTVISDILMKLDVEVASRLTIRKLKFVHSFPTHFPIFLLICMMILPPLLTLFDFSRKMLEDDFAMSLKKGKS